LNLGGDTPTNATATFNPEWIGGSMPFACTFNKLHVTARYVSASGTDNLTITMTKNSVDQPLTCTINATTIGTMYQCNSTASVAVVAGDIVGLHLTQDNTVPVLKVGVGTSCQ